MLGLIIHQFEFYCFANLPPLRGGTILQACFLCIFWTAHNVLMGQGPQVRHWQAGLPGPRRLLRLLGEWQAPRRGCHDLQEH